MKSQFIANSEQAFVVDNEIMSTCNLFICIVRNRNTKLSKIFFDNYLSTKPNYCLILFIEQGKACIASNIKEIIATIKNGDDLI